MSTSNSTTAGIANALLGHHREMLSASGINDEIAAKRGYRSARTKAELGRLGFGQSQQLVPALVIPLYDATGALRSYQIRPDSPRIGKGGKPLKYESPRNSAPVVDIHPDMCHLLADPSVPLFVTEGAKKADAATSLGLCCLALAGVYGWRGRNEQGGLTALPDWESIALNGRKVYLVFDSDIMEKRPVYDALRRLRDFLAQRKAKVWIVYLPSGLHGAKVGLDDFLANGKTVDDLLGLATGELRPPPSGIETAEPDHPYREKDGGLWQIRHNRDGETQVQLANFTARIVADVVEDDGAEERRAFHLVAKHRGREYALTIAAQEFAALNWPLARLGATAVVSPGQGTRDHLRAAIQSLSDNVDERRLYTHTGWRQVGGAWVYLHANGAIGADGRRDDIGVSLGGDLGRLALPDPPEGEALAEAVRASLGFLAVAPQRVIAPLLAATYRAALGGADFSVGLFGPTGTRKTTLAAICVQHFGASLDSRHLPANWSSTANALETLLFRAKDTLLPIDDFAPSGTQHDVARLHAVAERVLRGVGNQSGRQRLTATAELRPAKPPRALPLVTGEDTPRGQSLMARLFALELSPGDVDLGALTGVQSDAKRGLLAGAMVGFVHWVAGRYEAVQARLRDESARLRQCAERAEQHARTPGIVGDLGAAWALFLTFAFEAGAIEPSERSRLWDEGWAALVEAAAAQAGHQRDSEPTQRFLTLLASAIGSGRAHLAGMDGKKPQTPATWGWREQTMGTGVYAERRWSPQGGRVGWVDDKGIYLDIDAALAEANRVGQATGEPLTIGAKTLMKRLHQRNLLSSVESGQGTLHVRRMVEGQRKRVAHLHPTAFLHLENPSNPSAPSMQELEEAEIAPPWMDLSVQRMDSQREAVRDFSSNGRKNDAVGRIGQVLLTPDSQRRQDEVAHPATGRDRTDSEVGKSGQPPESVQPEGGKWKRVTL